MKILLMLLFAISSQVSAVIIDECGEYQLQGKILPEKSDPYKIKFLVFPETKSTLDFRFTKKEDLYKVSSYLGREIELKGKILKSMNGTQGELVDIKGIKLAMPNPLNMEIGFKKIESLKCL